MNKVSIRKFEFKDIKLKIDWINNSQNNKYLHYDLPMEYDRTVSWFNKNRDRKDRYDAVIEVDNIPVGLIGLLSINYIEKSAEYYVSMGNVEYKGKGIAFAASKLLIKYAFNTLRLSKLYLYTEKDNIVAQKLFDKLGFSNQGLLINDLLYNGRSVDRYYYIITKDDYLAKLPITPIHRLDNIEGNEVYVKREDLIPYSFGGNKARKCKCFFDVIDNGDYDCIVTYGSSHSNHCRIVSNMAAQRNLSCYIITPSEVSDITFNSQLMNVFGVIIISVPIEQVQETIDNKLKELASFGHKPYFIPGGGHGNIGTSAYVDCYDEINYYERINGIKFDYIFFATGTGTTHSGLICGQLLNNQKKSIVGISIARKINRGRDIIIESIKDYFEEIGANFTQAIIDENTIFLDDFILDGYGKYNSEIQKIIKDVLINYGIPLDSTYTAKAFYGMLKYIEKENLSNKNILFIHTGGTPLFFDDVRRLFG